MISAVFKKLYIVFVFLFSFTFLKVSGNEENKVKFHEITFRKKKIRSFCIDYGEGVSELCRIGAHYDTDKSSQRRNISNERHCHAYTLFYDALFNKKRAEHLTIAELGILNGSSLLMWGEYFQNATIHGFDLFHLDEFKKNHSHSSVEVHKMNVRDACSISEALRQVDVQYDLIMDDTTHVFEDQIRIIQNSYKHLKAGGMLIIEDIYKNRNENQYLEELSRILSNFQDYYFVSIDHKNRNSYGWDNDKLFILVKAGAEPIFTSKEEIFSLN